MDTDDAEDGSIGSKKRKRVPLRDMDRDFSTSLDSDSESEEQQNGDDEDFEDGSSRSKKKLKSQYGHRVRHRTSRLPKEFPQVLRTTEVSLQRSRMRPFGWQS
jgi:hypothetical protein